MKTQVDYIIVGFGLAGLSFAEQLRKNNRSFIVISSLKKSSSIVAGGMYNPVILKRFTLAWESNNHLKTAIPFYQELERYLQQSFLVPMPLHRILNNIEEQNNWHIASDKPNLSPFLSTILIENKNKNITANFKFGSVQQSGRLKVKELIEAYLKKLKTTQQFIEEDFIHQKTTHNNTHIVYKNYTAKHIVFCEGFGMLNNPYFNNLPLKPSKGETITIKSEKLNSNCIIKSGVFIVPTAIKNQYLVGATYNWTDETWEATQHGKEELCKKLDKFMTAPYQVISQLAGIRPTVKDRRPLLGRHPIFKNMYILNGLGTRGVLLAPTASEQLYHFITQQKPLNIELDIQRFQKK